MYRIPSYPLLRATTTTPTTTTNAFPARGHRESDSAHSSATLIDWVTEQLGGAWSASAGPIPAQTRATTTTDASPTRRNCESNSEYSSAALIEWVTEQLGGTWSARAGPVPAHTRATTTTDASPARGNRESDSEQSSVTLIDWVTEQLGGTWPARATPVPGANTADTYEHAFATPPVATSPRSSSLMDCIMQELDPGCARAPVPCEDFEYGRADVRLSIQWLEQWMDEQRGEMTLSGPGYLSSAPFEAERCVPPARSVACVDRDIGRIDATSVAARNHGMARADVEEPGRVPAVLWLADEHLRNDARKCCGESAQTRAEINSDAVLGLGLPTSGMRDASAANGSHLGKSCEPRAGGTQALSERTRGSLLVQQVLSPAARERFTALERDPEVLRALMEGRKEGHGWHAVFEILEDGAATESESEYEEDRSESRSDMLVVGAWNDSTEDSDLDGSTTGAKGVNAEDRDAFDKTGDCWQHMVIEIGAFTKPPSPPSGLREEFASTLQEIVELLAIC